MNFFTDLPAKLPSYGLFLLAASRFMNIYFPLFYKKYAKTWRIILGKSAKLLKKFIIQLISLAIIVTDILLIFFNLIYVYYIEK